MERNNHQAPVAINTLNLHSLIFGMQQLCEGLLADPLSYNVNHYISRASLEESEKAAYNFVSENYDIITGAIRMIEAAADIMADALGNDDIAIVPGTGSGYRAVAARITERQDQTGAAEKEAV